ncbi:phosphotransferase family protein [Phytoactinopolyspora halotolerans]|uniref:Aminoglycoside phosphotransferase family protein n=1 Tax=Phytoactinopolyspora halotolerans TaxID=1981512 RepID=A0A6L9SHL2_9ACTN|nr:phosphotransferase [Phytoactinopolyspora halotolerans]NEE04679.1 aminoglycoside phosphotransferase family protein [Phytoactinopolyspora halotolerans]
MDRTDTATARRILAWANTLHGTRFRLVRRLSGGFQSGTWLVRADEEQHEIGVFKWSPDRAWASQIIRGARAVELAREAGYPTPAWVARGVAGSGLAYHIQEYVPGRKNTRLTLEVAETLTGVIERHDSLDVDPGRCWSQYVQGQLAGGWDDARYAIAQACTAGSRFVASVDALVAAFGDVELPTGDLVHGDFRLGNVLFRSAQVAAVIDIEALGSGTRVYDYATLLTEDDVDPAGWEFIRAAGAQVAGTGVLARCFALVAVELADFVRWRAPERLSGVVETLTVRVQTLMRDVRT